MTLRPPLARRAEQRRIAWILARAALGGLVLGFLAVSAAELIVDALGAGRTWSSLHAPR